MALSTDLTDGIWQLCCQLFDQKSELLYVKNPATFFLVNVLKYARGKKILKLPYLYIIISNNFMIKNFFLESSDKILKLGSTGYVTYGTLGSVGKTILPPVYAG